MTAAAAPALAATSWAAIADRIDRPRPTLLERFLRRLGIGSGTGRLLAATPALQLAGLAAVAAVALAAGMLSRTVGANGLFLVLAPLVPLAAVAASFAPAADPAGEAGVGTPLHGAGLVLRRAGAVLAVTFGLLGVAALALPDLGPAAAAWVLPALALTLGSLALGTWLRVEVAVGHARRRLAGDGVGAVVVRRPGPCRAPTPPPSPPPASSPPWPPPSPPLTVLVARRDRFATLEVFR